MEFVDLVTIIKQKFYHSGRADLAEKVNDCIDEGGTLTERWLILAEWLKKIKHSDKQSYNLVFDEAELILKGVEDWRESNCKRSGTVHQILKKGREVKIIIPLLILISVSLIAFCLWQRSKTQADYYFIGKFRYIITNQDSFSKAYLSPSSYGFVIGDAFIQGIHIEAQLDWNKEYIISLNHPIDAVYTNSEAVRNQNERETKKKPVEILQDKMITDSPFIFVYEIRPKGKYRLLLP